MCHRRYLIISLSKCNERSNDVIYKNITAVNNNNVDNCGVYKT